MMSATDVWVGEPSILGTRSPTASFLDRSDTDLLGSIRLRFD
jgi:hypothetical protein